MALYRGSIGFRIQGSGNSGFFWYPVIILFHRDSVVYSLCRAFLKCGMPRYSEECVELYMPTLSNLHPTPFPPLLGFGMEMGFFSICFPHPQFILGVSLSSKANNTVGQRLLGP